MLKNYLTIALRVFVRNKAFSLINVFGLALSMSVCLLLIVIVADQKSYDQFHANKDRIYRVIADREGRDPSAFATTPARLADALRDGAPGVEAVMQLFTLPGSEVVHGETLLALEGVAASANYFGFLDFAVLDGDAENALVEPYSLVVTQSTARALFEDGNAVGEVISLPQLGDFTVTGVTADPPHNSHLAYDYLISYSTLALLERDGKIREFSTIWDDTDSNISYVLLESSADPAGLQPWFDNQSRLNYPDPAEYALYFHLQPLTGIALGPGLENAVRIALPGFFVYSLAALAAVVMLSAGFNYMNLSLARSLSRAREVGVRKSTGANRWQVFAQFIGESVLLSVAAFAVALILLETLLLPGFRQLQVINSLRLEIGTSAVAYAACLAFSLLVGVLAGALPAYYLSGFRPVRVLKGQSDLTVSGLKLRKILIVAQFMLALVFSVGVVTLYQQTHYMLEKDYGFNFENIVNIQLQGNDYRLVQAELGRQEGVVSASVSGVVPGLASNRQYNVRQTAGGEANIVRVIDVDQGFIDNFGLTLLAGRNFAGDLESGDGNQVVVNETLVRFYGYGAPADAVGQTLVLNDNRTVQIIGVVRDFHYRDLREPIGPFLLHFIPGRLRYLNLRLRDEDGAATIARLQAAWEAIDPLHPMAYQFQDEALVENYGQYSDLLKVTGLLGVLSLSIATLGLLGIAALSAENRMKELGIRKVMGATDWSVLLLLARNFMTLLGIATVLAAPFAWYVSSQVLNGFAYRVESPLAAVVLGTLLMLGSGSIAVGSQAVRAAKVRPVLALRYE
jgi:putative ABC transport system permease protein